MFKINLSQMAACVEESRVAWLDADKGPPEPTHYTELIAGLEVARMKLPPLYRTAAAEPFLAAEDRRGVEPPDYEVIAPLVKWATPIPARTPGRSTRRRASACASAWSTCHRPTLATV